MLYFQIFHHVDTVEPRLRREYMETHSLINFYLMPDPDPE